MNQNRFIEELKLINVDVTKNQLDQLNQYYELLIEYNKVMNLTGITEKNQVYLKHFYDSLTLNKIIDLTKVNTLCDIGTGAGFPGVVLKIIFPNLKIVLVDSLNKRINFLNEVIKQLNLNDIVAVHCRAEEFARNNIEKFDITTARAVAHTSILLEYAIPMTKINGYFVPLKANMENEIKEVDNALKELNTIIEEKLEFELPIEESNRTLIKFKKLKKVNNKYPRKNSEIKNKRL